MMRERTSGALARPDTTALSEPTPPVPAPRDPLIANPGLATTDAHHVRVVGSQPGFRERARVIAQLSAVTGGLQFCYGCEDDDGSGDDDVE